MRFRVVLVSVGCLLLVLPAARVSGEPRREITVRWYNGFGLSLPELSLSQQTARDILRHAGFEPVWRTCRAPKGPSHSVADRCDDTLHATELVVRLVAVPRPFRTRAAWLDSLGDALVDLRAGTGTLATVFADHVAAAADVAGMPHGVLVGRTVAHELGHLLMGSTAHSEDGLMQRDWSVTWLKRGSIVARFSQAEALRMQHGFTVRSHSIADVPFATSASDRTVELVTSAAASR